MQRQRTWRLCAAALAITALTACKTELGPGDGGGTNPNPKPYPTLDGNAPQSFSLSSIDGKAANTTESFDAAVAQDANFIAVDLVMSKDGELVALASPDITDITDVSSRSVYANRKTLRLIDGQSRQGWFASDFTLVELQSLRAKLPASTTPPVGANNGRILSLNDVIAYAKRQRKTVGLYLQTLNPTYHSQLGLAMEDKLLAAFTAAGYTQETAPVIVRSLEVAHLKTLRAKTQVRLVQMINGNPELAADGSILLSAPNAQPYDFTMAGVSTTYAQMVTADGLAQIKTYANGISPWKPYVISARYLDKNGDGQPDDLNNDGKWDYRDREMMPPTNLVTLAHAAKLFVHPWAYRNDATLLASDFKGKVAAEYKLFYEVGVDGVFSDSPSDANKAR
ncbi:MULTISPECIES: glycerophosphodiester phosphodiesterase family protein [Comamonas]|uniref:glycerophosphodiester phosphodiesterase n=1 Tax=Comamonas squillarum TaxID=2977320 RepID=A0ABY5ZX74_9BURK|nr:glycerophosphodiester phosphodiesterase family protein [Comamonas sp. PR12]UXC18578.1 glycerophosphodiester phosphodiesterase family protein [Comamonas sp. PR12]